MTIYYRRITIFLAIVFLIVIIGFTPSYFKPFFENESIFHFHALPAVLWMIVLIVQPVLFNIGKIKIHRIVGLVSLIIAFLVFIGSLLIIDHMLMVTFNEEGQNIDYQFAFSSIVLSSGFLVFVALAYYHRKNIHLHSRYMISTAFFALVPGLIRIVGFDGVSLSQNTSLTYFISIVLIFTLILIDYKKGKVYSPYLILMVLFSLIAILFTSIHEWDWWRNLVDAYRF
ncbi:MAG: hypothetical protein IPM82_26775 [Saprospiraceae bacterium]|nr:hypothetical protein [Saprospiraceae bacterium]